MLKKFYIFLFIVSLQIFSDEYPPDYLSPSCELMSDMDILLNQDVKYYLNFNNRTFTKELFKKLSSFDQDRILNLQLQKQHKKKWIDSIFSITYKDKICSYNSELKIIGDTNKHVAFNSSSIDHSVLIRLVDANIDGITEFRLLVPKSRKGDNEIFGAKIFSMLGFLSPRTSRLNININGNIKSFIFQENINKEFLEYNKRTESIIFEGSEIFGIAQPISLARISNPNWSVKSIQSKAISIHALSVLNNIYIASSSPQDTPLHIWDVVDEKNELSAFYSSKLLKEFYALSYIVNGVHGLSRDDSRFYFNNVYGFYEPIYYDGKLLTHEPLNLKTIEQKFQSFDKNIKEGVTSLKHRLAMIDQDSFYKKLTDSGFKRSKKYFDYLFNNIEKNIAFLERIEAMPPSNANLDQNELNLFLSGKKYFDGFLIPYKNDLSKIKKCNIDFQNCILIETNDKDLKNILGQKFTADNVKYSLFFEGLNKKNTSYPFSIKKLKSMSIDNVDIRYTQNVKIHVDKRKNLIELNVINNEETPRIIFFNGQLKNWDIAYKGVAHKYEQTDQSSKFSKNGLTGCLSFHDIDLSDITIMIENSICEDALHFLRATGDIENIVANWSTSDAIDIDFSKIRIGDITISNAKNDCLDLSNGHYVILSISATSCGDKALSVGENSNLINDNIVISNSLFGVASKDSSSVMLNKGKISSLKTCGLAYRKKQEYNGAFLDMKNVKCSNEAFFSSNDSIIIHN